MHVVKTGVGGRDPSSKPATDGGLQAGGAVTNGPDKVLF